MTSTDRPPAPTGVDVAEAARMLRAVVEAVERGELDAPPLMLARLTGALDALESLVKPRS